MEKLGRLEGAVPEAPLSCEDYYEVHKNTVEKSKDYSPKELKSSGPFCIFPPKKRFRNKTGLIRSEGHLFASLTEAALAVILKTYIPEFRLKEGETFQIPLFGDSKADFKVGGCIVEFHSPRLGTSHGQMGDFTSRKELLNFHHALHNMRGCEEEREDFIAATKKILLACYRDKRSQLIERGQQKGKELIVVATRADFYYLVINRFAGANTPSISEFMALYWWLIEKLAVENGLPVKTLRRSQMMDRIAA